MNVRIHFKDFTTKDHSNVKTINQNFSEYIELQDSEFETIESYDKDSIHQIEIRP